MKKVWFMLLLSSVCFSLTACGVKGPLYHPTNDQPVQQQNS
ncbi:lipoprotein [Gallibacterium trehalosifermentans]|uniref:Lipoprotein n=1 Tax=Gallibacterium trehalosifermentans TaxID=516935 RepID=A0ABV6H0Z2_9PAST